MRVLKNKRRNHSNSLKREQVLKLFFLNREKFSVKCTSPDGPRYGLL